MGIMLQDIDDTVIRKDLIFRNREIGHDHTAVNPPVVKDRQILIGNRSGITIGIGKAITVHIIRIEAFFFKCHKKSAQCYLKKDDRRYKKYDFFSWGIP